MMIRDLKKIYTEHEIVEGIKNNDEAIITNLTVLLKPKVFRWVWANSGTKEDAEDNFEQTWIVVLTKVKTGKYKEGNFVGFFKQISRNLWLKEIRDHRIERNTGTIDNEMKDASEEELNWKISKDNNCDVVHQNFMQLDEKCREILTLKYIKDIKMKDIAHQMNISEDYVKVKLFRCKKRLLDLLGEDPDFTLE